MEKTYKVPLIIVGQCYCDTQPITVSVMCDDTEVFQQSYDAGVKHDFRIDQEVELKPNEGRNQIKISWSSAIESPEKFLDLYKISLNKQSIPPHSAVYKPYENEYIQSMMQGSDQDAKHIKDQIYNPGNRFGWYGDVCYIYRLITDRIQENQITPDWHETIGGLQRKIYATE